MEYWTKLPMKSLKQLIEEKNPVERNKFVTREYQDYGYRLAAELADLPHKALYIKLAKETDRAILEQCRRYVLDANVERKGALFMWKMKELRSAGKK